MTTICFTGRNLLNDILPVYSAPISWSPSPIATGKTAAKRGNARQPSVPKQDEIQRVFKLPIFPAEISQEAPIQTAVDPGPLNPITIVEKTCFDLDKVPSAPISIEQLNLTLPLHTRGLGIPELFLEPYCPGGCQALKITHSSQYTPSVWEITTRDH